MSCVDSRAARRALHHVLAEPRCATSYWLDLGNTDSTAQVVLGEPEGRARGDGEPRLPCVTELFPELLDERVTIEESPHPISLARVRGEVEFRDVTFSYGREPVLERLDPADQRGARRRDVRLDLLRRPGRRARRRGGARGGPGRLGHGHAHSRSRLAVQLRLVGLVRRSHLRPP